VAEFNFADNYRAAGLTPSPDALRTRQEPFDKLRQAIDPQTAIDLTRLYFGLSVPRGTDWFRDAFGATDASFSLIDNAREASVLAAGLLEAAAADGKMYVALATLTTAAGGLRQPPVRLDLIDVMRFAIQERAVSARQQAPADPKHIKLPAASKLSAELTALTQGPEITKASVLLKQVSEESAEITKTLTNEVLAVIQPLAAQILTLREEVEMLWWHVGGWSRMLDKPFAELELGLAAVLAGVDMADMSRSDTGPAAAPAIFQRILAAGRKSKTAKIAIRDAVDALPQDQLDHLKLPNALGSVPEICPVLTAYAKAKEIGAGPAWHVAYARATGFEAGAALTPLELAMQAYRERLFLRALV
jgi:hypothetical protein